MTQTVGQGNPERLAVKIIHKAIRLINLILHCKRAKSYYKGKSQLQEKIAVLFKILKKKIAKRKYSPSKIEKGEIGQLQTVG